MTPNFSDDQRADADQITNLLHISMFVILALSIIEPIGALREARTGNAPESTLTIVARELFKLAPILPTAVALHEARKICERTIAGVVFDSANARSLSLIDTLLGCGLIWSAILVPIVCSQIDRAPLEEIAWLEYISPAVLGYVFVLYAFSRMFKILVSAIQTPGAP